jgi:hypothetical protein
MTRSLKLRACASPHAGVEQEPHPLYATSRGSTRSWPTNLRA